VVGGAAINASGSASTLSGSWSVFYVWRRRQRVRGTEARPGYLCTEGRWFGNTTTVKAVAASLCTPTSQSMQWK